MPVRKASDWLISVLKFVVESTFKPATFKERVRAAPVVVEFHAIFIENRYMPAVGA